MAFFRKCILLLALAFCASAYAQDVKFSYQSKIGIGKDTILVWARSMTNSPVNLGAVNLSWVYQSSCLSFTPGNTPTPNGFWSLFRDKWGSFLEASSLFNVNTIYAGDTFDRRVQYGNAMIFPPSVIVPANSQSPLLVMKLWFSGSCTSQIYMEDEAENPLNQIAAPGGILLTYVIENLLSQPLVAISPKGELSEASPENDQFLLSPNPSEGQLTMHMPDECENIRLELWDLHGRLLYEEKIVFSPQKSLDFPQLATGQYLLRLVGENGKAWQKKLLIK